MPERVKGVLIADHNPVVRAAARFLLWRRPDIEVCGETENGLKTIDAALNLRPDLIILDMVRD